MRNLCGKNAELRGRNNPTLNVRGCFVYSLRFFLFIIYRLPFLYCCPAGPMGNTVWVPCGVFGAVGYATGATGSVAGAEAYGPGAL